MNLEKKLLEAAVNSREASRTIKELVPLDTLSDYSRTLLQCIQEFYDTDSECLSVDKELLQSLIQDKYPKNSGELCSVLQELGNTSPDNVIKKVQDLRKKELARELAAELINKPDSAKVRDLWTDLTNPLLASHKEVLPCTDGLEELLTEVTDDGNRIRLYPNSLDSRLSLGARHGNHVVLFARPNVGKTAFNLNLVRGFLRDGRKVLYICNEEPASQVLTRLVSRITGRDTATIKADVRSAVEEAQESLDLFYIRDLTPGTFKDIHSLVLSVKPDVLILDQLRNIKTGEDNRVLALDGMARAARDVGKEHGVLVISVTQAGDSARNKLVLDDGDIDYSNTGIPGAADLIIGIGCNDDYRSRGKRMITIVKNKLGSDHSSFPVSIDEEIAKILSL